MKILVLSDIHANVSALKAVLDSANGLYQGILCLGDLTGYGPDPEACLELLEAAGRSVENFWLLGGNHDAALGGSMPLSWFNPGVRGDIERTKKLLSPRMLSRLAALPPSLEVVPGVLTVHGSPIDPLAGYLWGGAETSAALQAMTIRNIHVCFCGHTHETAVYRPGDPVEAFYPVSGETVPIRTGPMIVNPGSVGFPRFFNSDRRPDVPRGGKKIKASSYPAYYCVWDTGELTVLFLESRYDRRPMDRRIRSHQEG